MNLSSALYLPKAPFVTATGEILNLRFYPEMRPAWFGELGVAGPAGPDDAEICPSPDPDVAFVRGGSQAYIVNVAEMTISPIASYPVRQMKADPYRNVIWLVSFDRVEAVTSDGHQVWKSNRLCFDDLCILEISSDAALIEGFDGGSIVPRRICITDGKIVDDFPYQ